MTKRINVCVLLGALLVLALFLAPTAQSMVVPRVLFGGFFQQSQPSIFIEAKDATPELLASKPPADEIMGGDWWNNSWAYRINITIDHTKVDSTTNLIDYPMFINLSHAPDNFFTNVNTIGKDIRITNTDDTERPREIVFINTTAKTGEIHFLGNLSNDTNTTFYLYYGNPSAEDYAHDHALGRNAVWSNYAGVWHFQDKNDQTTAIDSKGNYSGTATDSRIFESVSKIHYATDYSQGDDWVNITNSATSADLALTGDEYTVSFWFIAYNLTGTKRILNKDAATNYNGGWALLTSDDKLMWVHNVGSVAGEVKTTNTVNTLTWYQLTAVYKKDEIRKLYLNGNLFENSSKFTANALDRGTDFLHFARLPNYDQFMNGSIDEVRIMNSALSIGEVKTMHNNQNSPATFYTIGSQETKSDSTPPTITLNEPTDNYYKHYNLDGQTTYLLNFSYEADDESTLAACWLFINATNTSEHLTPERNETQTFTNENVTTNTNTSWFVSCTDAYDNNGNSTTRHFMIKTTNSTITPTTLTTDNPNFAASPLMKKPQFTALGITPDTNMLGTTLTAKEYTIIILLILLTTLLIMNLKRRKPHEL